MEVAVVNGPPPPAFLVGLAVVGVLVVLNVILTAVLMAQAHKIPGGMGLPHRIRWVAWQPEDHGVTVGQLIWRAQFDRKRHPATAAVQLAVQVTQVTVLLLFLVFMAWQVYAAYQASVG